MKKELLHYAFSSIIFVTLFMWFYFVSHEQMTKLYFEQNQYQLIQQHVSFEYNIFFMFRIKLKFFFKQYIVSHEPFNYETSKKILILNPISRLDKSWGLEEGNVEFQKRNCPVKNCILTSQRQLLGTILNFVPSFM